MHQVVPTDRRRLRQQVEPAPVRVPRERKAPVVVDEGPLVLVETKKDLSQFKLPFETAQQETQGRA